MGRLSAILLFVSLAFAQDARRILYVTHSAGFRHGSIIVSRDVLRSLDPRLAVTPTEDLSLISAENLRNYDAVLFFTSGELALTSVQRGALLEFVRAGKGFAGVHSATDTLYNWPEYGDLVGGYFDGHPWVQEVRMDIEDPSHPAVAHLAPSFAMVEEIYQFREFSRSRVRVLMTLDTTSVNLAAPGTRQGTENFPLAWVRPYGQGRVFYTALGHFDETWRDQRFQAMLRGALLWITGQADGDPAPRPAVSPQLDGIGNAATGRPEGRVAPGALVSVYGGGLTLGASMPGTYNARLAGTVARLDGRRLPLIYASPGQLNAWVPGDSTPGDATLTVEVPGSPPASRPVRIGATAPGVFAVTSSPGALTVWATGLNGRTPLATLDGVSARVLFAGPSPLFRGLDQINIEAAAPARSASLVLAVESDRFFEGGVEIVH